MILWYGPQCEVKVNELAWKRLAVAGRYLRDYIRTKLSIPNVSLEMGQGGKIRVAKGTRGTHPSKPGEYPRKLTGHLRRNVQLEEDSFVGEVRVGTNVPYGKYLEMGTRHMKRRPWLSRAVYETLLALRGILEKGNLPK